MELQKYTVESRNLKRHLDEQFQFCGAEIRTYSRTAETWHHFVRPREVEIIFSVFGDRRFERALEIGSGDGLQSDWLATRCGQLVCSDIDSRRWDGRERRQIPENVSFVVLDATDLSHFPDDSFDLVYSSNALEHIEKIDRCISEIRRVLKPSGVGIHSMPSRHWKIFNNLYRLAKFRKPKVHGVERTNWRELIAFGLTVWIRKFEHAGFAVEKIYGMPFYFGAGGRWNSVVRIGNRFRLPSSHTFFVRPKKVP